MRIYEDKYSNAFVLAGGELDEFFMGGCGFVAKVFIPQYPRQPPIKKFLKPSKYFHGLDLLQRQDRYCDSDTISQSIKYKCVLNYMNGLIKFNQSLVRFQPNDSRC